MALSSAHFRTFQAGHANQQIHLTSKDNLKFDGLLNSNLSLLHPSLALIVVVASRGSGAPFSKSIRRQSSGKQLRSGTSVSRFAGTVHLEAEVKWLDLASKESSRQGNDASNNSIKLPLMLSDDVHLPGAEVRLTALTSGQKQLYNDLLSQGGRLLATSLLALGGQQIASYGTLLFLEDIKELPNDGGRLAEHRAIGRLKIHQLVCTDASENQYWQVEAEVLDDVEDVGPKMRADALSSELRKLEAVQGSNPGFAPLLAQLQRELKGGLESPLYAPIQGLWRAKSGQRIRIDKNEAKGVGLLTAGSDTGKLRLTLGSKEFNGAVEFDSPSSFDVSSCISWDDGDVWTRMASPPPYRFDNFGEVGCFWRAAICWQKHIAWQSEVRRRATRLTTADSIAYSLDRKESNEDAAAEYWERSARQADETASQEYWEEALRPLQLLLQADSHLQRIETFCELLRSERIRQQLRATLGKE